MSITSYPKRLIEVDLPIARISAHARREKSIRHGHISTLHIWWARRPLAACRAVICAALWPDPVDLSAWLEKGEEVPAGDTVVRPGLFLETAQKCMIDWGKWHLSKVSLESYSTFIKIQQGTTTFDDPAELRRALLDFIADFANWDNSTDGDYLETARKLTQAAHEALGGEKGTRPLVVDPFAGGGSIPLEALRVGADAFASDLNPVPVLLNKVVLEYIPKYGQRLADEVRKWGEWIKREAEKELAEFYPKDADGATPIAYLWARTIQCEGPGCGAEVPLINSLWLAKKANRSVALQLVPNKKAKRVDFQIIINQRGGWVNQDDHDEKITDPKFDGTVKRGSATCPCCGYTTPVARVREQFKTRRGGANDARLMCVVTTRSAEQGRFYRVPRNLDFAAVALAEKELSRREAQHNGKLSLIPDEPTPLGGGSGAGRAFSQRNYGMKDFVDLFTRRQGFALASYCSLLHRAGDSVREQFGTAFGDGVQTILACAVDREAEHQTSLCRWNSSGQKMQATFGRQALPIVFDFCEANPIGNSVGSWENLLECVMIPFETALFIDHPGTAAQAPAQAHPLPDDSASAFISDPPYYDAVPYSDLSDFFYVWLKRNVPGMQTLPLLTPKDDECIVDEVKGKEAAYFEATMKQAMAEGWRVLAPSGVGVIVFAHKSTAGWEAQLQAMIDAGWIMTASWPIDTEMGTRLRAMDSAALASSVHLVCRPRENPDGSVRLPGGGHGTDEIGDWRDVLQALPVRIHEWMPRLADEGVVGADAIFACLGPALEIFSRYSRVEKSSGEVVPLREYLEQVWAAVSKEALSMIFKDADTAGLEPDARLTAMWLWTLGGGVSTAAGSESEVANEADGEEEEGEKPGKTSGFVLEFDAARKIAQGLGVHLEKASSVVEVKGETARLLSVAERTKYLFGKETDEEARTSRRKKKEPAQKSLFAELEAVEQSAGSSSPGKVPTPTPGATVLDQVHQAMILFAAGRGEAMKRFLLEDGVGKNAAFWKLAQSLSALYPPGGDEKRWVDGVLARKKGLGL
jgi:putative DNA methylase